MAKDNRKVVTRDRIMASALRIFAQRGFDATSVQSISEDASIAHGTIFWHFGSKESLYLEVVKTAGEQFFQAMEPMFGEESLPFMKLARAEIEYLRSNREISRICFSLIYESLGPHPELGEALELLNNRLTQIWHMWIEHCENHGFYLRANKENLVRIIVSTLSGVLVTALINPKVDALELLEDFALLVEPTLQPSVRLHSA